MAASLTTNCRITGIGALIYMATIVLASPSYSQTTKSPSTSAITSAEAIAQSPPKSKTVPEAWAKSEIDDATRYCTDTLKTLHAVYEALPPTKQGRCGAPGPIRLISIGRKNPVKFDPPPMLSCRMLAPLKRWIDKGLQPLAERYLDTRVTAVSIMSSYSCRTRYGRKGARMSEHAYANALDIGGFRLADAREVRVIKHWGPTRRDITKSIKEQKAKESRNVASAAASTAPIAQPQARLPLRRARRTKSLPRNQPSLGSKSDVSALQAIPPLPTRRPLRRAAKHRVNFDQSTRNVRPNASTATKQHRTKLRPPFRLGAPKEDHSASFALFLRGIHQSACRIFGTTLGPEANEAHRNHFHIDMFPRRRRGYCE